jgi:hypothetical protein
MPMIKGRLRNRTFVLTLLLCLSAAFSTTSCSTNKGKAKTLIQEYMKNQGITDLTVDSFFTNPAVPGKAYTSATVTYNFASSSGNPQRDFLGFILAQEGSGWRIERTSSYTKDQQQASKLLAGGK